MGATNQIKGTNLSLQLDDKKCPQCNQLFTQQEIDDRNFDIWFDTTNDVPWYGKMPRLLWEISNQPAKRKRRLLVMQTLPTLSWIYRKGGQTWIIYEPNLKAGLNQTKKNLGKS